MQLSVGFDGGYGSVAIHSGSMFELGPQLVVVAAGESLSEVPLATAELIASGRTYAVVNSFAGQGTLCTLSTRCVGDAYSSLTG